MKIGRSLTSHAREKEKEKEKKRDFIINAARRFTKA